MLSTIGVALSTALIGGGFLLLSRAIGFDVPAIWCFVFGALISPTDPVSVMGVLKRANVSPVLEATVAGESLFNDGVGVGVVTIPLALAARSVSVLLPLRAIRPTHRYGLVAPVTLIWGGLRGGISIALALGLPDGPARSVVLAATYVVVLFSVIVQGGTIKRVLERLTAADAEKNQ